MEKAGITVIVYSWWGYGDRDLDGVMDGHPDQFINQSVTEMIKQIRDSERDMKVALIAEPFTVTQAGGSGELSSSQSQLVLDYLWDHYYGKYPDQMFEWEGKPLVVTFDPMRLKDDGRYTIKSESTDGPGWRA